jgi:hypothetical protein
MIKVQSEGTSFYYLLAAEAVPDVEIGGIVMNPPDLKMIARIRHCPDVRAAIFEGMRKGEYRYLYYLFWSDEPDLKELDRRVIAGTYTDADFTSSVRTAYQDTFCSECGARWHTLIIPGGDPYPGAWDLLQRKFAMSKFLLCPACRASLRQAVVKILGPADGSGRAPS